MHSLFLFQTRMWIQKLPTWLMRYFKTSKFLFSQVYTLKSSSCQNPSFQSEYFQNPTKTTSLWVQHQNLHYPRQISHNRTLPFLSNVICFYSISSLILPRFQAPHTGQRQSWRFPFLQLFVNPFPLLQFFVEMPHSLNLIMNIVFKIVLWHLPTH